MTQQTLSTLSTSTKDTVCILSGGFDPVHEGHIAMFIEAKEKYGTVVVGLNSDQWLDRKKGKPFMRLTARTEVIKAIKYIDYVIMFDDSDNTAVNLITHCLSLFKNNTLVFGNGGDRTNNFPEYDFCVHNNVKIDDTLGGSTKKSSSSILLKNWENPVTTREWGYWRVLQDYKTVKVKELVVLPKKQLSWQKHYKRSELWFIKQGIATLYHSDVDDYVNTSILFQESTFTIPVGTWHSVSNLENIPLTIIEIQYGSECIEEDIIRKDRFLFD